MCYKCFREYAGRNEYNSKNWGSVGHEAAMTESVLRLWQSLDSDELFEAVFLAAPIMLHSVDKHGQFVRVSKHLANTLGYDVDDMLGQPILAYLTEDSRAYAEQITIPEFHRKGKADSIEYDFLHKSGKILPLIVSAMVEYDKDGEYVRSLAVSFDNSTAKMINQELQRKSKVDAIGSLVGGVAHDFNNLLAVVQGNLDFLLQNPDEPQREELIRDAFDATKRGASMINELLTYGRRDSLSISGADVNDAALTATRLVQRLFPSNIEIQVVPNENLWKARVDAALLETAILNILNNARDAMPNGGKIRIDTSNVNIDEEVSAQDDGHHVGLAPGRYVRIGFSDTGRGIEQAHLPNLFKPFFTTKPQNSGSGLGLAMVMGFVEQSRGTIHVNSEPGAGTTFWIYLPVGITDVVSKAKSEMRHRSMPDDVTVLIVEDDSSLRRILARQLQDDKIRIFEAETGDAAFKAMHAGLQPDLLLTDVVMPGSLQGPDLVQRARAILPDLRVLFISGYPPEIGDHSQATGAKVLHLTKPVSQDRLKAAVTDLLLEG